MDTKNIKKGMVIQARHSKINYRLERIIPRRTGKNIANELHFESLEPKGQNFKMMEEDFQTNAVLIIQQY